MHICQNMMYYMLYMTSILFLYQTSSFCYFLAQFESKTVCPRSLGPIHILGYYAIRNVSRFCWKLKVFRRKILYLLFCNISGIQQKNWPDIRPKIGQISGKKLFYSNKINWIVIKNCNHIFIYTKENFYLKDLMKFNLILL